MEEVIQILDLFKSRDKEVHKIAYELFNRRLSQDFDLNFMSVFMNYSGCTDHVPGKVHNLIYMKLIARLEDNVRFNAKYDLLKQDYDNLFYSTFVKDCLSKCEGFLTSHDDVYEAYKKWHKEQNFTAKLCTKGELKQQLEVLWSQKLVDNKWTGYRLLSNNSDVSNFLIQMTEMDTDSSISVTLGELYKAYRDWTKEIPSISIKDFNNQVNSIWDLSLATFNNEMSNYRFIGYRLSSQDSSKDEIIYFIRDMIVKDKNCISTVDELYKTYCKHEFNVNKIYPFNKQYFVEQIYNAWGVDPTPDNKLHGIRVKC